ncbi:MAG: AraC family transcriptional regulator [Kiritimatiellia bacterium]
MRSDLLNLSDPENYFEGKGTQPLPTPSQILFFLRSSRQTLQQKALQNRSHHRTLLCYNLQTEGTVHLDHREHRLKPGQILTILPFQFHHYSQLKSSRLKWLFCSFECSPMGILEPLRNRVIDPGNKSLLTLQQLLEDWQAPPSTLQPALLQCTLLRLILCLRKDLKAEPEIPANVNGNELLQRINQYLEEWRGPPLRGVDLARELGYSESHLRILFKQSMGIPLGTYLQNYRINRTISLLLNTSLSIHQVAEEAGFGSPQACCRMFKQATGQTPRAFRSGHTHSPLSKQSL